MSRYPGTQFRVHDNSQATAIVPITKTNANDAVQYLSAFASIKGPEGITFTSGEDFYTRFGTQDNINFKKYGQPLLQASMNINNGAALLAKRVVLDDASLGNATLGVVITKYKEANIVPDKVNPGFIGSIEFNKDKNSKYSIAPMVFSINNLNDYVHANAVVNEHKERYNLYKNYIIDCISNENTPDNTFLNKLFGAEDNKILSGFTQSVYYTDTNKLVDVTKESKSDVRKVSSITTGIYNSKQKTYSSSYDASDITDTITVVTGDGIKNTAIIDGAQLWKVKVTKDDGTGKITDITWEAEKESDVSYKDVVDKSVAIERIISVPDSKDIVASLKEQISDKHPEWLTGEYVLDNIYALVADINTEGYTDTIRLMNDMMVEKSGYVECEYVFPLFTIFDNGRGESIKSISIEYDSTSSVTLKKAVYTLSVYNYATAKRLEKFSFSLNPYTRNNSTGYSFDIESAVNYVSKQISVKTYYESYDALLETLQAILQSTDSGIIENNDILFGHMMNGKYPVFNSYHVSSILNRNAYVYDYAHLDIFDNDIITVNAYCDSDNMTISSSSKVKYYFYNYIRQQKGILERLENGTNGYCLDRKRNATPTNSKVPFIVIDSSDTQYIIDTTGQVDGAVISSATGDIQDNPVVISNFKKVGINVYPAEHWVNGTKGDTVYLTKNLKTLSLSHVFDSDTTDEVMKTTKDAYRFTVDGTSEIKNVWVPYSIDSLYQEQYRRFYSGEFDKDIFNLDIYFPNAIFDANYSDSTKMAIQRLAAYRGDFMCYMDMGINKINSYADCYEKIPSITGGLELTENDDNQYKYVRDMHVAVTCLSYKIRNPYDNKVIAVTGTYGLSNLYISHFKNDVSTVFAGISNNVTINNIIEGSANYIPKIYPTNEMTSINNIGGVYPSDDETIINEKQLMCDLRVNYGCYYNDRFSIETEFTMNPSESEFSYFNNVALVCLMMQSIRKACPTARYQFITTNDLTVYQKAVETAMEPWKNRFAGLKFKYVQDDNAVQNKIFYAAIEVVFKPFAQAEIFDLTALNYSTLSSTITNV